MLSSLLSSSPIYLYLLCKKSEAQKLNPCKQAAAVCKPKHITFQQIINCSWRDLFLCCFFCLVPSSSCQRLHKTKPSTQESKRSDLLFWSVWCFILAFFADVKTDMIFSCCFWDWPVHCDSMTWKATSARSALGYLTARPGASDCIFGWTNALSLARCWRRCSEVMLLRCWAQAHGPFWDEQKIHSGSAPYRCSSGALGLEMKCRWDHSDCLHSSLWTWNIAGWLWG